MIGRCSMTMVSAGRFCQSDVPRSKRASWPQVVDELRPDRPVEPEPRGEGRPLLRARLERQHHVDRIADQPRHNEDRHRHADDDDQPVPKPYGDHPPHGDPLRVSARGVARTLPQGASASGYSFTDMVSASSLPSTRGSQTSRSLAP